MKYIVFILLISLNILFCSCIRVNPQYAGIEGIDTKYTLNEINFSQNEVYMKDSITLLYRMDKKVLQSIVSHSQKQFFLLYCFDLFCSSEECRYYDTVLQQFYEDKDVALVLFTADNPLNKISIEKALEFYRYPVFMLDCYRYGNERNLPPEIRFMSFLSEICPQTSLNTSVNSFILLDGNLQTLLEGQYNSETKQKIMNLIQ
ncbi:MAG: hypothetical protein LBR28_04730 [Bacteroidales bacterium]|nr:hypothetical protein [Bacteroidales bacterium]